MTFHVLLIPDHCSVLLNKRSLK